MNLLVENGAKYDVQAHVSYHGNRSIDKPKRVLKEVCSDLGGNGLRFLWVCFVHLIKADKDRQKFHHTQHLVLGNLF